MASSLIGKITKDLKDLHHSKQSEINDFYRSESGKSDYDLLEKSPEDKSIVNLDLIVEKWITYMWETTKSKSDAKYDLDELNIVIDWKRCEITQNEAQFDKKSKTGSKLRTQTLFRTFFCNKTDTEQEYSFRTDRTTRQSCSFTFLKGFSREKEGGISFKLPEDIVEIGGGMRSEQTVEMGKDTTKEEEVSWGVNTLVKVKPHSRTNAELIINEIDMDRDFKVEMILSGRLSAILNTKRDQSFVKAFSADITQILHMAIDRHWLPKDSGDRIQFTRTQGTEKALVEFNGRCKFRVGVEQHVNLNESKL